MTNHLIHLCWCALVPPLMKVPRSRVAPQRHQKKNILTQKFFKKILDEPQEIFFVRNEEIPEFVEGGGGGGGL